MRRSLTITSEPANLCAMRKFALEFSLECGLPEREVDLLVLGLDEACSNVIRHAYQNTPGCAIRLVCDKLSDRLRFRLRDYGKGCNPEELNAKLRARSLEAVRPGGLGLHFIHKAFDEVRFIPKEQGTELVLTKKLGD